MTTNSSPPNRQASAFDGIRERINDELGPDADGHDTAIAAGASAANIEDIIDTKDLWL